VNIDFRPTTQCDAAALADFLGRVFQLRAGSPLLDEKHMGWKYWTARPDWEGSRSFTAQHHGAIVAHAAAWPVRVRVSDQEVTALTGIDWAADWKYPGAGNKNITARRHQLDHRMGANVAGTASDEDHNCRMKGSKKTGLSVFFATEQQLASSA
jgi:hypothetical protein